MKNFIQPGRFITIKKPGVKSGESVLVGDLFGIASHNSIEDDDALTIAVEGVFELDKETPKKLEVGQTAYFDPASKLIGPDPGQSKHPVGIFVSEAAEDSPKCVVRLTPTCTTSKQVGSPLSESEVSGEGSES